MISEREKLISKNIIQMKLLTEGVGFGVASPNQINTGLSVGFDRKTGLSVGEGVVGLGAVGYV